MILTYKTTTNFFFLPNHRSISQTTRMVLSLLFITTPSTKIQNNYNTCINHHQPCTLMNKLCQPVETKPIVFNHHLKPLPTRTTQLKSQITILQSLNSNTLILFLQSQQTFPTINSSFKIQFNNH